MILIILPVAKVLDIPREEIDMIMREDDPDVEAQQSTTGKQPDEKKKKKNLPYLHMLALTFE